MAVIVSRLVALDDVEAAYLDRPVQGKGGWQNLLRKLQGQRISESLLWLIDDDPDTIRRYCKGDGGFQGRLRRLLS